MAGQGQWWVHAGKVVEHAAACPGQGAQRAVKPLPKYIAFHRGVSLQAYFKAIFKQVSKTHVLCLSPSKIVFQFQQVGITW